jgi:branched-chain amino acid transport system substrate-binding protein
MRLHTRRGRLRAATTTAVLVAAGVIAAACSPQPVTPPVPVGDDIVIGASLEQTGPGAAIGAVETQALQLAADSINTTGITYGGELHRIRLVILDNGSDPQTAAKTATSLINSDHAIALVGGALPAVSLAIAPVAESHTVLFLSFAAAQQVTQPIGERRYVYTLPPRASDVASVVLGELRRLALDRVAVFATAGPHGDDGVSASQTASSSASMNITQIVRFAESGADLTAKAKQVVSDAPEVVLVWAIMPPAESITRALRATGYKGKIIFDPGAGLQAAFDSSDRATMEGTEMVHPAVLGGADLAVTTPAALARQDFFTRYTSRFHTFSGYAPYGADAIALVANAVRVAAGTDSIAVRDAMETSPYDGIAGGYIYSAINHSGIAPDQLAVFQAVSGAWVRIS